jgi:hypothetical protein
MSHLRETEWADRHLGVCGELESGLLWKLGAEQGQYLSKPYIGLQLIQSHV